MKILRQEVGKSLTGERMFRHLFIYDNVVNYFTRAHTYFTKKEKMAAKRKHKRYLKQRANEKI